MYLPVCYISTCASVYTIYADDLFAHAESQNYTLAILPVPIASCSPVYPLARTLPARKPGMKWQPDAVLSPGKEGKKVVLTAAGKKSRAKEFENSSELGVTVKQI